MLGFHALSEASLSSLAVVVEAGNPFSVSFLIPESWLLSTNSLFSLNLESKLVVEQSISLSLDTILASYLDIILSIYHPLDILSNPTLIVELLLTVQHSNDIDHEYFLRLLTTSSIVIESLLGLRTSPLFGITTLAGSVQNLISNVENLMTVIDENALVSDSLTKLLKSNNVTVENLDKITNSLDLDISNVRSSTTNVSLDIDYLISIFNNIVQSLDYDGTLYETVFRDFDLTVTSLLEITHNFNKAIESQGTPPQEISKDFIIDVENLLSFLRTGMLSSDFLGSLLVALPYDIEYSSRISLENHVGVDQLLKLENGLVYPVETVQTLFTSLELPFNFDQEVNRVAVINLDSISQFANNEEMSIEQVRRLSITTIVDVINQLKTYPTSVFDVEYDGILVISVAETAFLIWRLRDDDSTWRLTR